MKPSKKAWLLLSGIVLFGLALRLIFFSGMFVSFSLEHARAAAGISQGLEYSADALAPSPGLIYLTALSYSVLGINEFSSILFVLLCSIGMIVLAFCFGKLLFNERAGLLAAFLVSFFPLEVQYATQLISDVPAAFFMSLGVFAFLHAEMKRPLKMLYLMSGLLIGIAYLMQKSALLIFLFFAGYIIYKKKISIHYIPLVLGVVAIIVLESLIFLKLTGDPLYRLHQSQMQLQHALLNNGFFGRRDFPMGLLHYPWLFLSVHLITFFYIFVAITAYFFVRVREKKTNILLLWLLPILIYLSVGTTSVRAYAPFSAIDRYLCLITIPSVLLLAYFLMQKDRIISKVMLPSCLVILLMSSIGTLALRDDRKQTHYLEEFAVFAMESENAIYMDSRTKSAVDYLNDFSYQSHIRPYNGTMPKGSYFVVNRKMMDKLEEAGGYETFPKEAYEPPRQWKLVQTFANGKILVYLVS